jgi:hypothetical protein
LETIRLSTTAHIAKRITDFTTEGCRPNAFADQDLVESCQSRSSPDSPEGAGSTHQQVRSSGDTPIFTGRSFSKFSVVFCHSVELIERLYLTIVKFPLSLIISTGEKFYQIPLICISRLGFIICSTVKVAVLS